jgi:glycosyltransferase involved in cell wall biosynthesis
MRVVQIASGDTWGGAERVMALLAEGIATQPGFSVEALLFNEGRLAEVLRRIGISVTVIPESRHSFGGLTLATRRWLKIRNPDIVHAHRYKEILAAALAIIPRKRGFVATVHGLEPSAQLPRSRILLIWGTLLVARLAGVRLAAVSSELERRLKRILGGERLVRIPNPIPPLGDDRNIPDLRRQLGWSASRPLVGFVGRLEHVKGPDIFVDVAARCQMDAGFVLVGGGGLANELSARVAAAGATDRVAFLGEVPDATPFIRQFDVLALSSRHEGLPLVLLEAAASEVPIVAFDVGGVREVRGSGGSAMRLVAPADYDGFREAVEEVLRDPERARQEAKEWAKIVRSRFSLATISSHYCDLYRSAVAPRE